MAKRKQNRIDTHNGALENLVNHLDIVGINRQKVDWVIKELDILYDNSTDRRKSCDIIVGYNTNKTVDLIEVKRSKESYDKAKTQIENTQKYFADKIGYKTQNKYIYYYLINEYDKI